MLHGDGIIFVLIRKFRENRIIQTGTETEERKRECSLCRMGYLRHVAKSRGGREC